MKYYIFFTRLQTYRQYLKHCSFLYKYLNGDQLLYISQVEFFTGSHLNNPKTRTGGPKGHITDGFTTVSCR